jgi:hypothetical protein
MSASSSRILLLSKEEFCAYLQLTLTGYTPFSFHVRNYIYKYMFSYFSPLCLFFTMIPHLLDGDLEEPL